MSIKTKFIPVAVVVAAAALVLLVILIRSNKRTFPSLPVGAYVGRIVGLEGDGSTGKAATLFVERGARAKTLLFVIFSDSWTPQAVAMNRSFDRRKEGQILTENIPLEPVTLRYRGTNLTLHGVGVRNEYSGEFHSNDGRRGTWSLRKAKASDLIGETAATDSRAFSVDNWLRLKAQSRLMARQIEDGEKGLVESRKRLAQLKEFIQQEDVLKDRAVVRQANLEEAVSKARSEKEEFSSEVSSLVSELDLLGRITGRGKLANLARKVSNRENKWYLANWRATEDLTGLEEYVGDSLKIDLRKLGKESKRANEVRSLQQEISNEKAKIQALQEKLRERLRSSSVGGARRGGKTPEQSSLWNKLFGG